MYIPSDWPQDEVIDLAIHDLPHSSSDTEWWYFNCHFTDNNHHQYSLFVCFFMHRACQSKEMAYYAVWGLTNCQTKQYETYSCVDKNTPSLAMKTLTNNSKTDMGFHLALAEVLKQNKIPSSDHLIHDVSIDRNELSIQFDNLSLHKNPNQDYVLTLSNPKSKTQVHLQFRPRKPVCTQGEQGITHGPNQEQMYYYFIPRCQVQGSISTGDTSKIPINGQGWYDHEFGYHVKSDKPLSSNSWTWMSIQLENGYDLSLYQINHNGDKQNQSHHCKWIDPDGQQQSFNNVEISAEKQWKSMVTFCDYDCQWRIKIDDIHLDLQVTAVFDYQELPTLISYPSFWEGRCSVQGTLKGKPVSGICFVEQLLSHTLFSMSSLFSSFAQQVDHEVKQVMPLSADKQSYTTLFASQDNRHYLDDVDCQQLSDTVIAPIRTITDRNGKRWRSYILTASCHLVGGLFDPYISWLAIPELIHSGSLIIDDIQDKSSIRRGGSTCHQIYGEPLAINAGSLAYGLFEAIIRQSDLSLDARCQIYQIFFDTYRAAHVGQAFDLIGYLPDFCHCIEHGNSEQLQRKILATHRLKSAVPASLIAKMGVVLGGGTKQQAKCIAGFFEKLGIAFQIIDDVLNLSGFDNDHKQLAEDISAGKVTYPIAKAIPFLSKDELYWIGEVLQYQSNDSKSHQLIIDRLKTSGVLDICRQEAQQLLDEGWQQLDAEFPQSHTKLVLRAFSHYIINRTT